MHQSPAESTTAVMSVISNFIIGVAMPKLDTAVKSSTLSFNQPEMIRLNQNNRYGWTHFGIFLPKLPAPFNYCNVMTLLGSTGTIAFDNDYLIKGHPRDNATLLSSTALGLTHHYQTYSIQQECLPLNDNTLLRMGKNLTITGSHPTYQVCVAYDDFVLDLTITCTDVISWFVKNIAYDHWSLLAECYGRISKGGYSTVIPNSLCTFEYARCMSSYLFTKQIISDRWKIPLNFFTYQIINLDETTQILLTKVGVLDKNVAQTVQIRTVAGNEVYADDVSFEVLEYQALLAVAPDGKRMRLPQRIHWTVNEKGTDILSIEGIVDSTWRFGHGRGYVACYQFTGRVKGNSYVGQGYIEYADCI